MVEKTSKKCCLCKKIAEYYVEVENRKGRKKKEYMCKYHTYANEQLNKIKELK